MIDIHERALNAIGETLITLQDETVKRMSDALEAAERTAAELRAQLATAQAALELCRTNYATDKKALCLQLEAVTDERDELKRKYDRACNCDFLNEALNSGDGVYRP